MNMANYNDSDATEAQALALILRFLSNKKVTFPSVPVALCSITASRKYKLSQFAFLAVTYIASNLSPGNVLVVLEKLISSSSLCCCKKKVLTLPSAPALEVFDKEYLEDKHTNEQNKINAEQEMYDAVVKKCLEVLDKNAVLILKSEQLEEIPLKMLQFILKRDTLCIPSELSALQALDRWSRVQCFLRNLPPSPSNKQAVLAGTQYLVRYLTMSPDQIKLGQAQCGLLREKEVFSILKAVSNPKCTCPLNRRLQGIRDVLATPRISHGYIWEEAIDNHLGKENAMTKEWDCEAQEYITNYLKSVQIHEKDYAHIGDCIKVNPDEDDESPEESEHIYQSIEEIVVQPKRHEPHNFQEMIPTLKEKRCTCVKVKRSRSVYNQTEMQKYRAFYQRGGRYSRERVWSNGSNCSEYQSQTQEFNTLEKLIFCLACMFD